jgi:dipeptidyl aminopeptidase/acylaminoacyl peptidase
VRANAIAFAAITLVATVLGATALSRPAATAAREPVPWATLAVSRSIVLGGGVYVVGRGQKRLVAAAASEPAWSPDGRRLAYVAPGAGGAGDIFVADANGTHARPITQTSEIHEAAPTWSPDGRRMAYEQAGWIIVARADGSNPSALVRGEEPSWSPGGRRIAFQRAGELFVVGANGRRRTQLTTSASWEMSPAWSPDARRLAFVSDEESLAFDVRVLDLRRRSSTRITADEFVDSAPAFSANGRRVVFASERAGVQTLWSVPTGGGPAVSLAALPGPEHAVPRPRPAVLELPPDLDQQAPSELDVRPSERGFRLWFTSAADNVGLGPLIVMGRRPRPRAPMSAAQRVRLTNGSLRTNPRIGIWRYNGSPDHAHWHLLHFQRYELRGPAGSIVVRDRKSGFCIGDRYGVAPGRIAGRVPTPRFRGFCNLYSPGALDVDGGTSVGYSDRYHSRLDGQNLDITRVPAGEYVLVNRVNPQLLIRELRYENNAASVRIRLSRPNGRSSRPTVRVLKTCPDSDRCS